MFILKKVIIENNSFTMDTRNARLTRLDCLFENIEEFSSELSLSVEKLLWAKDAFEKFNKLLNDQENAQERKIYDFERSNDAEEDFYERYIGLKELIATKLNSNKQLLRVCRLDKPYPANKIERFNVTEILLKYYKKNRELFEENDIPEILFQNLEILTIKAKKAYSQANLSRATSKKITNSLNKLFEDDSYKLRELFNWVVAFWSKKNPNLLKLGFSIPISNTKNKKTPDQTIINLKNNNLTWKPLRSAEIYQVAWRNKENGLDWIEVDLTKKTKIELLKTGEHKVRGLNEFGWGPWSEIINYKNLKGA